MVVQSGGKEMMLILKTQGLQKTLQRVVGQFTLMMQEIVKLKFHHPFSVKIQQPMTVEQSMLKCHTQ